MISQYRRNSANTIYSHASPNPDFDERFLEEARVMARLKHPHIVPVHDFFFLDDVWYLVMDYIAGGSLEDLLKRRGRLALGEALHISRGILEALNFAHHPLYSNSRRASKSSDHRVR